MGNLRFPQRYCLFSFFFPAVALPLAILCQSLSNMLVWNPIKCVSSIVTNLLVEKVGPPVLCVHHHGVRTTNQVPLNSRFSTNGSGGGVCKPLLHDPLKENEANDLPTLRGLEKKGELILFKTASALATKCRQTLQNGFPTVSFDLKMRM